jgi:hypothetical protein
MKTWGSGGIAPPFLTSTLEVLGEDRASKPPSDNTYPPVDEGQPITLDFSVSTSASRPSCVSTATEFGFRLTSVSMLITPTSTFESTQLLLVT